MEFQITCRLAYRVIGATSFLFNVAAVRNSFQRVITEDLTVTGAGPPKELLNGEQRLHRVAATNGRLNLAYNAVVSVEPELLEDKGLDIAPLHELPLAALVFLYPSRSCQSDLLARFATREFTNIESGFERLTRICNWIYQYVEYLQGATNSSTSAFDTATQRAGVCRDSAHLGIALCGALGIPARFVSAYVRMDSIRRTFMLIFRRFWAAVGFLRIRLGCRPSLALSGLGRGGTRQTHRLRRFSATRF